METRINVTLGTSAISINAPRATVGDASPKTPQPRAGEFFMADVVILLSINNVRGNEALRL